MSTELSPSSPFPVRFWAWMKERFPPAQGVLFFVLYAAALLFGRFLSRQGPLALGPMELLGFVAVWAFFFTLRIVDEHKDYREDCRNHPERVLQRGLITLGHLKIFGGLAIALQAGLSIRFDGGLGLVCLAWLALSFWSALMSREFFLGDWLKSRLPLYAALHLLVMPLALLWMAQMGAGTGHLSLSVAWLALLSFFSGAAFELTRKTLGPEEEREGVDSYSRSFGVTRMPLVIMAFMIASAALQALLVTVVLGRPGWHWYLFIAPGLALALLMLEKFRRSPSAKARKRSQGAVSLSMLLGYLIVIVAIVVERGILWSWSRI